MISKKIKLQKLNFDEHSNHVLDLFKESKDFFLNFENSNPNLDIVKKTFFSVPEGVAEDKKIVIGHIERGKLLGFAELIKDRHREKEWLLSLLLLAPKVRKSILGGKIILSIFEFIKSSGATCVVGGVVEENEIAKSFWRSINAVEMDKVYNQEVNGKLIPTRVFYKEL